MNNREKAIEFLKEYEKLCQNYKLGLHGCGCCGSPYLDYGDDCFRDINYYRSTNDVTIDGLTVNNLK